MQAALLLLWAVGHLLCAVLAGYRRIAVRLACCCVMWRFRGSSSSLPVKPLAGGRIVSSSGTDAGAGHGPFVLPRWLGVIPRSGAIGIRPFGPSSANTLPL